MSRKIQKARVVGNTLGLNADVQANIVNYVQHCKNRFDFSTRRHIYQRIDKAIQLESDARRNLGKHRDQRLDYYDDIEVSLVTQAVDTVKGFLVDLFLARPAVFEAVASDNDKLGVAAQIDAINEKDSKDFAWARHLTMLFGDLAKYNFGAIECEWESELVQVLESNPMGGRTTKSVREMLQSGNKLKRCDVYNSFYDDMVEPADVHRYGEYGGYHEKISMIELVRRIRTLKAAGKIVMNQHTCFNAVHQINGGDYYKPTIVVEKPQEQSNTNWMGFFNNDAELFKGAQANVNPASTYLWTTMYARMIPEMYGIGIPGGDKVGIYKISLVGGTLVCMERMTNIHNYLGIVFCMIKEEGIGQQVKSDAALVIPLQNLATKIYDARLASLANASTSKYAYIENMVDPATLRHPNKPVAVKPNMLVKDPLQAVKQFEFRDTLGPIIQQEIGFIKQQAYDITRLNRAQMGQFQKGNKTAQEFNEIMNNADSELRTYGLLFENSVMEPLKSMIKANIAQFQDADEIVTSKQAKVPINPADLSVEVINFKLADGLTRKEQVANLEAMNLAYQTMLGNPMLMQQFDVAGVYIYMMELMGAKISQYRMTQQGTPPAPAQGQQPPAQQPPQQ